MTEFEIQLRDVMIYAYHGVLPEEKSIGNQYRVNVRLRMDASWYDEDADDIASTVSYVEVYELLLHHMARRASLLETVAVRFANDVKSHWPAVVGGSVEIVKTVPPIPGMIGEAGVKYSF